MLINPSDGRIGNMRVDLRAGHGEDNNPETAQSSKIKAMIRS